MTLTCTPLRPPNTPAPRKPHLPRASSRLLGIPTLAVLCMLHTNTARRSQWDVSEATTMSHMFHRTISLRSDLSHWSVGRVVTFGHMFLEHVYFQNNLSEWNMSSATVLDNMFRRCQTFTSDLCEQAARVEFFDVRTRVGPRCSIQPRAHCPRSLRLSPPAARWDVSRVETMNGFANGASSFTSDLYMLNQGIELGSVGQAADRDADDLRSISRRAGPTGTSHACMRPRTPPARLPWALPPPVACIPL